MIRNHWMRLLTSRVFVLCCLLALGAQMFFIYGRDRQQIPDAEAMARYEEQERYIREHYREQCEEIIANAQSKLSFSIFSESGYERENLRRMADAYRKMLDVEPDYPMSGRGVEMAVDGLFSFFLVLFLLLAASGILFLEDRERGRMALILPTRHGRGGDYMARLAVLCSLGTLAWLVLQGMRILWAGVLYGFGDLSRPIQSVLKYSLSTWRLSVGEFLWLYNGLGILILLGCAILLHALAEMSSGKIWLVFWTVVIAVLELAAYFLIPEESWLSPLRFLNLFSLLSLDDLPARYQNRNLFGLCVSEVWALVLVFAVFVAVSFILGWQRHIRSVRSGSGGRERGDTGLGRHLSLWRHEWYKVLVVEKAWIFLLLLALFSLFQTRGMETGYGDQDEFYLCYYLEQYHGELTKEKEEQIRKQKEEFVELQERKLTETSYYEQEKIWEAQKREGGFALFLERCDYVRKQESAWLIDTRGYDLLAGEDGRRDNLFRLLAGVLGVLFCLYGMWTIDNREKCVQFILPTVHGGKRLRRVRYGIGFVVTTAVFLLTQVSAVLRVEYDLGWQDVGAPVGSLKQALWSGPVTVGGYLLSVYILRFLLLLLVMSLQSIFLERRSFIVRIFRREKERGEVV